LLLRARTGIAPTALRLLVMTSLAAALLLTVMPSARAAETTRLEGTSNVEKSIAFSEASFADDAAPTALLARDDDFADSLTSSAVQGLLDAPLLLTNPQVLSPETTLELQRLGAEQVVIMGGEDAVGPAVQTELEAMGYDVSRVGGATRVETSIEVAQTYFPNATHSIVARAFGDETNPTAAFADSLAAGTFAATSGVPLLLTDTDAIAAPLNDYLNADGTLIEFATIAGGTAAVSNAVVSSIEAISTEDLLAEAGAIQTERFFGPERGSTAVALNMGLGYTTAADAPRVLLIEGFDPDAWASGLAAGAQAGNGIATVLADGDRLFDATTAYLGAGADVPLICGPGVNDGACDAASDALGNEG
jgi:putative cell wall-binding protein